MKTVLVCANVYPPRIVGGAELIAHYQSKALSAKGYGMAVFAGDFDRDIVRYSLADDTYEGLRVFRVGLHMVDYASEYVNFSHSSVETHFERVLDIVAPDVVHMHNLVGLSVGLIRAAKCRGIKTVLTLHDHWGFCFKNTLLKNGKICDDYSRCSECMRFVDDGPAQRKIPIRMRKDFFKFQLEAVDAYISPSLYLAGAYVRAGVPVEKMHVIWYGIDVERFSKIQKLPTAGPIRFTFVGRLGMHKGADVLIKALRLVGGHRVFVNLVGTGEFEPQLREIVGQYDLYSKVKFWGQIDHRNVELILRETDVLVLPSIWPENQPVTITEAMASRIPVIASDIGGIPELVVNGENGYLFKPGSEVDLAEKMLAFVDRPDRLATFGENGFERIKDKTYEHQVDRIAQLYD